MAKKTINFARTAKKSLEREKLEKNLQRGAIYFLSFYIFILAGAFGASLYFKNKAKEIEGQKAAILMEIDEYSDVESLVMDTKKRYRLVADLLVDRGEGLAAGIERAQNFFPDSLSMDTLSLANQGETVSVGLTASNLGDLIAIIDQAVALSAEEGGYNSVSMSGIRRDEFGYEFDFSLELDK